MGQVVDRADLTLIRITWRGFLGRHIMDAFDLTVEIECLRYAKHDTDMYVTQKM